MISKEEMYEFASQIAGISDSDLEQYKCGGRMKKEKCGGKTKKKMEDGGKTSDDSNDDAAVRPGEKVIFPKSTRKSTIETLTKATSDVAKTTRNAQKVINTRKKFFNK